MGGSTRELYLSDELEKRVINLVQSEIDKLLRT
jgi:hypothetical protein